VFDGCEDVVKAQIVQRIDQLKKQNTKYTNADWMSQYRNKAQGTPNKIY
jgi:hypothetical protein